MKKLACLASLLLGGLAVSASAAPAARPNILFIFCDDHTTQATTSIPSGTKSARIYGVVTDRYKLVHSYKPDVDDWELYDRQADPLETRNFIGDPQYAATVAELKAEIGRLRSELKVPAEAPRHACGKYPFDGPGTPPPQPKAVPPEAGRSAAPH